MWKPIIACIGVCSLAGFAGGLVEQWVSPTPVASDNYVDLGLGMGAMGLVPGVCWAFLERVLEKRGGDWRMAVSNARRRLVGWTVAGLLLTGLLGALVLGGMSMLFTESLQATGFKPPSPPLFHYAILGFLGGGLVGAPLGFIAALIRSFKGP